MRVQAELQVALFILVIASILSLSSIANIVKNDKNDLQVSVPVESGKHEYFLIHEHGCAGTMRSSVLVSDKLQSFHFSLQLNVELNEQLHVIQIENESSVSASNTVRSSSTKLRGNSFGSYLIKSDGDLGQSFQVLSGTSEVGRFSLGSPIEAQYSDKLEFKYVFDSFLDRAVLSYLQRLFVEQLGLRLLPKKKEDINCPKRASSPILVEEFFPQLERLMRQLKRKKESI